MAVRRRVLLVREVIARLQAAGLPAAVQNPLTTLPEAVALGPASRHDRPVALRDHVCEKEDGWGVVSRHVAAVL